LVNRSALKVCSTPRGMVGIGSVFLAAFLFPYHLTTQLQAPNSTIFGLARVKALFECEASMTSPIKPLLGYVRVLLL
jgi:hypothetical protein